ncbi:MAG: phospholipid/cholesterol/gamma-HCH transport system substrate-binding protein [Chloroflexota bacterium]|nr:phospholipid/cholesterol/gamma-HCH transport system substrate-binding protein [Chloroflexota bacterium]
MTGWIKRLTAIAVLGTLVAGGLAFGPFGNAGYHLKLDFTNSDGVVKGNKVTIDGVDAGSVDALELRDNVAVISVTLDSKFTPLRAGTKALIRSLGLLGNHYVEIIPGPASGAELPTDSELTIDSTTSPTDLDQINAIFDAPTRDKIKAMTLQGEIALGGRATALNADLRQLRNLAVAAEPVTGIIDDHQVALDRATIAFDTLTQNLVREDASLRGLVEHGGSLLSAVEVNNAQLAGLLQHGDTSLTRLDHVLAGNENNLAGFFARQPSGLQSTDYQLVAAIPATRESGKLIPSLFDLLYDMADSTTGRDGSGNPDDPNSGTQYALRAMSAVCVQANQNPC